MKTASINMTKFFITQTEPKEYVTEASSLGFKAGSWPDMIFFDVEDSKKVLYKVESMTRQTGPEEEELDGYVYSDGSIRLTVFND